MSCWLGVCIFGEAVFWRNNDLWAKIIACIELDGIDFGVYHLRGNTLSVVFALCSLVGILCCLGIVYHE